MRAIKLIEVGTNGSHARLRALHFIQVLPLFMTIDVKHLLILKPPDCQPPVADALPTDEQAF